MSMLMRAAAAAILLSAFLVVTATRHVAQRAGGEELVLDVAPVDPRDILLGHFVRLGYEAERLDLVTLGGDDAFVAGDRLYLAMRIDADGIARPVSIHRQRPPDPAGPVLEGRARTAAAAPGRAEDAGPGAGRFLLADFGLPQRYYADAETAVALETELREGGLQVIVATAPGRDPVMKGLIIEGERRLDTLL